MIREEEDNSYNFLDLVLFDYYFSAKYLDDISKKINRLHEMTSKEKDEFNKIIKDAINYKPLERKNLETIEPGLVIRMVDLTLNLKL